MVKSGGLDIPSRIPRIPLGIAGVPGEVCSVFILPSVASNHSSTPGGKRKQKHLEREPCLHPLHCPTLINSDILTHTSRMNIMQLCSLESLCGIQEKRELFYRLGVGQMMIIVIINTPASVSQYGGDTAALSPQNCSGNLSHFQVMVDLHLNEGAHLHSMSVLISFFVDVSSQMYVGFCKTKTTSQQSQ